MNQTIKMLLLTAALATVFFQPETAQGVGPNEALAAVISTTNQASENDGGTALREGDYNAAIAQFTEAISSQPTAPENYYGRGLAYYENAQLKEALIDADRALKLNPEYSDAHCLMGKVYFEREQYDFAIRKFNQAAEFDPDNQEAKSLRTEAFKNKIRRKSASSSINSLRTNKDRSTSKPATSQGHEESYATSATAAVAHEKITDHPAEPTVSGQHIDLKQLGLENSSLKNDILNKVHTLGKEFQGD